MKRTAALSLWGLSLWTRAPPVCFEAAKSLCFRHLRDIHACYEGSQLLRRLEHRNRSRRNLNRRSGAWVARHAGFSVANLECAEPSDLDVLLGLKRFLDRFEESVHDASAIFLGNHRPGCA